MRLEVRDPDAMHALGVSLGAALRAGDLVILTGPLGAGKTTLTRGIGEGLGVRGPVQSPTFVLARTHPSLVGAAPLVHLDAYRLGDAAELDDLDIDFEGSVVVAEWGAGMVDTGDSWIELTLERPTGGISIGETIPGVRNNTGGEAPAVPAHTPGIVSADEADELGELEVRVVTVDGHGPRGAEIVAEIAEAIA